MRKFRRADIAALFVSELQIDKLVEKKRPKNYDNSYKAPTDEREMKVDSAVKMADVTDIGNHWAKNFISDIVDLKIRGLEPYPDHTFHPDQLVNRGEYAMVVEDAIIAILHDPCSPPSTSARRAGSPTSTLRTRPTTPSAMPLTKE